MKILSGNDACAAVFAGLCVRITGKEAEIVRSDDGGSDLVLIGSDAVNPAVHELIRSGKLETLGIRTGTDDYRLLSLSEGGRRILILAGGRTRADYYAVYDYFERFCGCRWFWDGDRIPERGELPLENIDVTHKFRFRYRGLRYFAHRSLHRFQAEHWSWPEWKTELDYLVKKKFNLFMLRIGHDDLFQKAFPETVGYPPEDRRDPDAIDRSFDDRTVFWGLRERSRLRKKIMDYAKKLDLIHPVDMGPMTHWYSPTPVDFLKKEEPKLLRQTEGYDEKRGAHWDVSDDRNLENYWKLTRTDLKYYDTPDMFHIIGLAERRFGSERDNLQLKLYAYRRFIRKLRSEYPDAPLLIAAWDFMVQWNADEVRRLLEELDPENTILFDYTQDIQYRHNDFLQWGLPHRFPYIFGIFQGVERYTGTAFDFRHTERNFELAQEDPCCKGMIMWPEMAHAHTLLHEYLAKRSSGLPFSLEEFCRDRYGEQAQAMGEVWRMLEKEQAENSFHLTRLIFDDTFNLLAHLAEMYQDHTESAMREEFRRLAEMRPKIGGVYAALAKIAEQTSDRRTIRDIVDLARTHLMSDMLREFADLMTAVWKWRTDGGSKPSADRFVRLTEGLHRLLATDSDYSLADSLRRLAEVHPLNPASEETLKSNAENSYCRTYITELCLAVYIPEAKFLRDWLKRAKKETREEKKEFLAAAERIRDAFYRHPLSFYQKRAENLPSVLRELDTL